ncbi:putative transposase, mutator type, MULE transposase domain protein [Tanacetum coccineum]
MLAPKCSTYNGRPTFANPRYLKKAQSEKPCLYEIPYDNSDHANRFAPDREETMTLANESRSKLNKGLNKNIEAHQQPNAQRIPKPSVLGKPTPFSNSPEMRSFQTKQSVNKTNVSDGSSKQVTQQNLPQNRKQAEIHSNVLKPGMYRIATSTTQNREPQLPHASRNTNPHVSTSTGVNHSTSVSRPQLKSYQVKDKVVPNNSQVKFTKKEVEDHHRISSISKKTKFVLSHLYLNDVNARTKKPKVVPISASKPKRKANKSVATPHKKTVASDTTIQKPKSYFKELYENTNKAWKWWIEKKCPSEYKWTQTTPSRPSLKWKPTGRIFSNVRLRWIPTGKLLNSCTGKVESEPTHGSNVDIPHIHACKQTLGLSAGTSFNGQKQQRIDLNADALYNQFKPRSSVSMTSDHNCSELKIYDHSNESSSSKLVPKVVPPVDKKATSRQELESKHEEGIEHQTSSPRLTNKRHTCRKTETALLVEVARICFSASKLPLSFWAEAVATNHALLRKQINHTYRIMKRTLHTRRTACPQIHENVYVPLTEEGNDSRIICTIARLEAVGIFVAYAVTRLFPIYSVTENWQFFNGPEEDGLCCSARRVVDQIDLSRKKFYLMRKALYGLIASSKSTGELKFFLGSDPPVPKDLSGEPVDQSDYRSKIGSLMYLTSSRPELVQAYVIVHLSSNDRHQKHLKEDSDHEGCIDTRKSTSGGIQFLGDKLVSWMSKKQNCTAMSSAECKSIGVNMQSVLSNVDEVKAASDLCFNKQNTVVLRLSVSHSNIMNHVQHSRNLHIHTRLTCYESHSEDRFKYLVRRIGMRCLTPTELEVLTNPFKMRHSMRMLVKDTRSQDGIDDKDNDKGSKSRSQSIKEQAYNKEQRERPRPHELNDKSNLIDLMKEWLYALACEEDAHCLAILVKSFKLIEVYREHDVTALDSYIRPPRFKATIEDITDEPGSIATNSPEKCCFADVARSGVESYGLSHDEYFGVNDLDLNLNKPEPILAEIRTQEPVVEEFRTQEPIMEDVIVEDYVSSGENAEQGNGQEDESAPSDGQFFYDDEGIDTAYETEYDLQFSEDVGTNDDDDEDEDFLVDEENELVEPDVDVHLFGISMYVPFDNIGVTNLVPDDILEGEDVDVINANGFDSDLSEDNEISNYMRRRLAELSKEMEGVINASGQWMYSFYTGQKSTTAKEAKDRLYLHSIESRRNLKLYKNDSVMIKERCNGKVHVFTMSQGTWPTGPNCEMEAGPSGSSGPIRVNPDISVKAVQDHLQRDLEGQISMSKAFRVKAKAKREIKEDHVL